MPNHPLSPGLEKLLRGGENQNGRTGWHSVRRDAMAQSGTFGHGAHGTRGWMLWVGASDAHQYPIGYSIFVMT